MYRVTNTTSTTFQHRKATIDTAFKMAYTISTTSTWCSQDVQNLQGCLQIVNHDVHGYDTTHGTWYMTVNSYQHTNTMFTRSVLRTRQNMMFTIFTIVFLHDKAKNLAVDTVFPIGTRFYFTNLTSHKVPRNIIVTYNISANQKIWFQSIWIWIFLTYFNHVNMSNG